MEPVKSTCCKSKFPMSKKANGTNGSMSFLSTILLILLPKCPLCMTAYMSAMVMFFDIDKTELAPFLMHAKPVMGLVIILMILLNRKDKRTIIALVISALALSLLVLKTYYNTFVLADWVLYAAFIFAIWYNGNFQYFYRFIRFGKTKAAILEGKIP